MRYFFFLFLVVIIFSSSCKKEAEDNTDKPDDNPNIITPLPTNISDGDFENWTESPEKTFEEPSSGWWATLNVLKNLGGPVTVEKTTDAHTGNYAAKLTTDVWGTLTIPGVLMGGKFDFNAPNMMYEGKPFTEMPLKIKGYYKYTSVNNDSAAIYANITKYDFQNSKKDTIAEAQMAVVNSVNQYTLFELDFEYLLHGINPDSISIVFVSSADGANFNGQVGSTLFIDDVSLILNTGSKLKLFE